MAVNSCDPVAKVAAANLLYYQFTAPNNSTKSQVTFVIRGRRLSNVYGKEEAGVIESHVAWARTGAAAAAVVEEFAEECRSEVVLVVVVGA